MKKYLFSTLTASALLLGSQLAYAQNVQKLGYINAVRVYSESVSAQAVEEKLQKEFSSQQQKLIEIQNSGIALQQQLSSGALQGDDLEEAEEKLLEISRHYRVAAAELADEYNLRRHEEFTALQNRADNIIREIAKAEGFDLIVQEAVFVRAPFDITDRVIRQLDSKK